MDDEALLEQFERALERDVRQSLADVAAVFADELRSSTGELTAAYSVSRIATLFRDRTAGMVRRLVAGYDRAVGWLTDTLGTGRPAGWDDIPERYDDDPAGLPEPVRAYLDGVETRLDGIADELAATARRELAAGLAAGETREQLEQRLLTAMADAGAQLGEVRAARIARTEAGAAWSAATLAAARALPAGERPLVKQWRARRDGRTRAAHRGADGQLRLLDEPFDVGGTLMDRPGDPASPPDQVINCRCRLEFGYANLRNEDEDQTAAVQTEVSSAMGLNEQRTGHAREGTNHLTAADGGPHTGGMIALVPSRDDARRLAVDGGLTEDDLHCTLLFLGPADEIDQPTREAMGRALQTVGDTWRQDQFAPAGHGFALSVFNPDAGDDAAIVLGVSGEQLPTARTDVLSALADPLAEATFELPEQHQPWVPHVTLTYSADHQLLTQYTDRVGAIRFDRLRLAFAGEVADIPLTDEAAEQIRAEHEAAARTAAATPSSANRAWTTPGDAALAFEGEETGDGRIFATGSLYWTTGPWPLQYAEAMLSGHDGAELAGSITDLGRDGARITGGGILYGTRDAGVAAIELLDDNAPLGVSVDLDDVDVEFVVRVPLDAEEPGAGEPVGEPQFATRTARSRFTSMSLLPLAHGAWTVRATQALPITAAGHTSLVERTATWTTGPGGVTPRELLGPTLAFDHTAAAGDPDDPTGDVVHSESAGDVLMRITRGRVRGATLVAMPAYDRARIVLDPQAGPAPADFDLAAAGGSLMSRIIAYVSSSPTPVTASETARVLGISVRQAREHLARATKAGRIVRLAPGLYVGAATLPEQGELAAAASGDLDLPIEPDREREWDGDAAASRVLDWATGDAGQVDAGRLGAAFLYRDPDADPATLAAYKLGFADLIDGELRIVPRGVFAVASVIQGGRGGVDIPDGDRDDVRDRVDDLYDRLADTLDDPTIQPPWEDDDMTDLEASAWTAMRDLPPMPAPWFAEPTPQELPPGSGGVHYKAGRIYGWVAQAGEPHAGHPGKNLTIESLGAIDTSHFLRSTRELDDGTRVKVGALTMNVPHDRDGAECEGPACQFDDTRTVAGVVTVGMNSRGMWFSGAAGPWLSDWDLTVFAACQPSYHMRQGRDGRWQLRAVLSVPVPGHSSPYTLAASAAHQQLSAVVHRSNVALAASAAPRAATQPAPGSHPASGLEQVARQVVTDLFPGHRQDPAPGPAVATAPSEQPAPPAGASATPPTAGVTALASALAASLTASSEFIDSLTDAVAARDAERRAHLEALKAKVLNTAA